MKCNLNFECYQNENFLTLKFSVTSINNLVEFPTTQAVFDIIISKGDKTLSLVIT